jgi:hypothetical protein
MATARSKAGKKYLQDARTGGRKKRRPYYDAYPFGGAGGGGSSR